MKRVTVWTLQGCPWCDKVKAFLRQRKIRFTEHVEARGAAPRAAPLMPNGEKPATYPQVWVTSTRTGATRQIGGYEATTAYVTAKLRRHRRG